MGALGTFEDNTEQYRTTIIITLRLSLHARSAFNRYNVYFLSANTHGIINKDFVKWNLVYTDADELRLSLTS